MVERSRVVRVERADRILDTARQLLLSWGYRRVTIDELARRAGVGKGTIYLHWRSREEVFHAVSAREAAAMTDAIVGALDAALKKVRYSQFLPNPYQVTVHPALVMHHARAADDFQSADLGQIRQDFVLNSIRKIRVLLIVAQVFKGQHRD